MRLPALAALLCLAASLAAAEPAPPPAALIDNSRSSAAARDRLRFLAGAVLPREARSFVFDREVRPGGAEALTFASRWSDYLRAAETVAAQPAGALVLVAGDGEVEVVHAAMPPAYLEGLPVEADRLAVNAAVARRAAAALGEQAKRVRLVALAPAGARGLWDQVPGAEQRSLARLADLVDLARACRTLPAGEVLADPAVRAEGGRVALDVVEGCTALTLWVNLPGDPASAAVTVVERTLGKPLAAGVELAAGGGPLRALRITGLEAGAALEVRAEAGGRAAPCEVLAVQAVAIRHRMTAAPEDGLADLYSGEQALITHRFTRAPGDTPVSPALDKALRAGLSLGLGKAVVADPARVALPAKGGSAELAAVFAAPWAARVSTQPLALHWADTEPLRVAAGFQVPEAYDGTQVGIRAQVAGGRRTSRSIGLSLAGPAGASRAIELLPEAGSPRTFAASTAFTAAERGRWAIDAKAGAAGAEKGELAPPAAGLTTEHLVKKDWRLLIALGVLALLALIGLWLWWYLTRPRWKAELLRHADGDTRLKEVPGPRARDTSRGLPAFGHEVLFTKGRTGVTLTVKEGAQAWLNARPVSGSCELAPGSDLEVAGAAGRCHARFFASPEQAAAWTHEQALIDPGTGEDELFVVDEGGAAR